MKCIWSPTAAKSLDKTIDYIIDNFGASAALKFIAKIEQWDSWISENPEMARIEPMLLHHKKHEYRSVVIKPHSKIILFSSPEGVQIADLWDMRQKPQTLIKKLR